MSDISIINLNAVSIYLMEIDFSHLETYESALNELKVAYETKDIATIAPALDKINEAWKNASEEMYKSQDNQGAQQAQPQADASGDQTQDVDFEEVK